MELKSERFELILTPSEKKKLFKMAKKRNTSAGSILRTSIRKMGKKPKQE